MISIIVPIYNSEKWLEKCIDSLISQTYKNIEILLINDGSKDSSIEICKKYVQKDTRIRVIDKENEGVSKTRNLGIKEAKGEYIQFVDSDDYLEPDACSLLRNAIENSDMAICGMRILKSGKILREPHIESGTFNLKDNIDTYFNLRKINLGPCNKLYHKDKIKEGFKEDISLGEDTLFVLSYMENVNTVTSVSKCLYNVCLDNNNSLNRQSKLNKIDLLIDQRKTEEEFLIKLYGFGCNLSKMYDCYLLLLHSYFLQIAQIKSKKLNLEISSRLNNSFLLSRIEKSNPPRYDYKIFRNFFVSKRVYLLVVYFKLKSLLLLFKK